MTGKLRNALLIHNPNAGNGGSGRRRMLDEARRILSSGGIEAELIETRGPGDATEMAQRATAEGRQLGNCVRRRRYAQRSRKRSCRRSKTGIACRLRCSPAAPRTYSPRNWNLPWDIPGAAEKLIHGKLKDIALGLATPLEQPEKKRYFLSVAGAGPDGMIVYSIDLDLKARVGILAYWWQGAREVFRYKFPHFRVIGGGQTTGRVAGGRRAGRSTTAALSESPTGADLYEDEFELMALTTQSGFRYSAICPACGSTNFAAPTACISGSRTSIVCEPLDSNPSTPRSMANRSRACPSSSRSFRAR